MLTEGKSKNIGLLRFAGSEGVGYSGPVLSPVAADAVPRVRRTGTHGRVRRTDVLSRAGKLCAACRHIDITE